MTAPPGTPHPRHTAQVPTPVALITEQVRERVRREGVDLATDRDLAGRYVREEVRRYSERALGGSVPMLADELAASAQIVATLTGFGALQPLFDDPDIEEVWINAPDAVFVARHGVAEQTGIQLTDGEVRDLVERMLQSSGRRVDLSSPFVDASLPGRLAAARRDPRRDAPALGGERPQVQSACAESRTARRARQS